MNRTEANRTWQRGWVIGLALLSLIVPVAAGLLRDEPAVPFADPAHLNYYRQTVAALAFGLVCAVGAFVGNRALNPAWIRWMAVVLASLGVLISAFLLWALIGTCGLGVIWGRCTP